MMKPMLSLITIVAFIATSALCANIPSYDDEAVTHYTTIDVNAEVEPVTTHLSANTVIQFRKGDHPNEHGLFLYPEGLPEFATEDICKQFFGIEFATGEIYCNITLFGLRTKECYEPNDSLDFILHLESDFTLPLRVEIPVFQLPSLEAPKPQVEIKEWASKNSVSLTSPLSDQDLQSIRDTTCSRVGLKFGWLCKLLEFGLYDSEEQIHSDRSNAAFNVYVSRPIVLSSSDVQKLVNAL